jgi:hypothetical protein
MSVNIVKEYCNICGAQKVAEKTGKFDEVTGDGIMRMVCPIEPCYHAGLQEAGGNYGVHYWVPNKKQYPWYKKLFAPTDVCLRCGYPENLKGGGKVYAG